MHHHRFLLLLVGLVCCLLLTSFTTAQASTVDGRVTSVTTGAAISGATVKLGSASTIADSNGNYAFSNVAAGAYTLTGSASGYLSRSYSISVVDGTTLTQNIQLSVAGILSGTVTNTSGTGITGATVQYSGGVLSQTKSISTDTSGGFYTGWIPVGTYTVTASASSYQSNTATATVYTGKTTTVTIQLTSGSGTDTGTVNGKVTSVTTGAAISGATLTLGSASTTSDSSGNYSFANVAANSYTLTAKANGYLSRSYTISVTAGAATTQDVQLSVAGKIAGTVTSTGGSVIAGATVQVIGGVLNQTFTSTTNSTGAYNTGWIPIGNYNVTASASGSTSNPANANVNTGQTTTLNITASSGTTTGVTISPNRAVVTFATTQQFTSNTSVSWSVDGVTGGNSTVGTISTSGLYTPPQAVGQHTVTAASQADSSQTASATVWVSNSGPVLTHKYDNYRTGQNTNETVLTLSNVNSSTFGKLFSYPVDGSVYAQPLYVPNLSINGGTHNVVFVASGHDNVYAFDADGQSSTPYWKRSFLSSGVTTFPEPSASGTGQIGITSTPVIDLSTNTMYVVGDTQVNGSGARYQLHALDITTGAEKFGGPVTISGSVTGIGAASSGGIVTFDPVQQRQRASLLLANGAVYIAFASYADADPYHGWVFAYSASNLVQLGVFCDTPNGSEGGIWMAGGGLAADSAGGVYVSTGNGSFTVQNGGTDYGENVIRFSSTSLGVADWFAPFNTSVLNTNDLDLGSGGPLLLPDGAGGKNLLVIGGKSGTLYLLDRGNLGHWQSGSDSQVVQSIQGASAGEIMSTPAWWNGWVYVGSLDDHLKAFQLQNGQLVQTTASSALFPDPGPAVPVVSANGSSNGVVWALQYSKTSSEILRAWDATNLSFELYNSTQAGSRDDLGGGIKFTTPVVANGKVFVGTTKALVAYGPLP